MMNIDRALLLSAFAGYTGKLLILGANPSDALVVLILAAAHFLYNSQIQNKEIKDLNDRLTDQEKVLVDQANAIQELRGAMSSVKISQGLRPTAR